MTAAISALVLAAGSGMGWLLWLRAPARITDQDLLREAVAEWKSAGEHGDGPNDQIFEQQAAQGYYDDALATVRLYTKTDDRNTYLMELAKIRAENGDTEGAKKMIATVSDTALQARLTKAVALAQARRGDLAGALETSAPLTESNEVFVEFARWQIAKGDFDGALKTSESVNNRSADDLFYEIGDALRLRNEQSRVKELASHMSNRDRANLFLELVPFTLHVHSEVMPLNQCDLAAVEAMRGKSVEAARLLEHTKCWHSFVAVQLYGADPVGAEQLLRTATDPKDLAFGTVELACAAAKHGKIEDALRLDATAQQISGSDELRAVQEIARAWTIKEGARKVLSWARSRSTTNQRTWALIGMAEALGHARPQQYGR